MRTVLAIALAICCCAKLDADYSYQSRIQITGGQLYDALLALGTHTPGIQGPVTTTKLIKGNRMAVISKGHTTVIDLSDQTITEIEFAKKSYFVIPFSQMKKILEDAAARTPLETGFKVSVQKSGPSKAFGILAASEAVFAIEGSSTGQSIAVDSWIGTVPGYEQMVSFNRRLASKMGDAFASGMAELALSAPQALQGFGEAAEELSKAPGAPLLTTIKIAGSGGTLAEASIRLDNFGGGIQDGAKFDLPAGFKKVDPMLPHAP